MDSVDVGLNLNSQRSIDDALEVYKLRYIYPIFIEFDNLSKVVSIMAASSQIEKLQIEQEHGIRNERPQIHGYIYARIDSFKSTFASEVHKAFPNNAVVIDRFTLPSLIGTIDRHTHMPVIPLAYEANRKLLIVDEFDRKNREVELEAFKQLLEEQKYSRVLGYSTAKTIKKKGLLIAGNKISFESQFSFLILSMYSPQVFARDALGRAILSRMLIMQYALTKEQAYDVLKGKPIFRKYDYPVEKNVLVKRQDYDIILERFRLLNEGKMPEARTIGDMVRVFAVTGEHDDKLYEIIHSLHKKEVQKIEKAVKNREQEG
jgi:hypothetical protein